MDVVRLGAWCDQVTTGQFRAGLEAVVAEPFEPPPVAVPGLYRPSPAQLEADVAEFARGLHFRVAEFADLRDGSRVTLHEERGWSMSGPPPETLWAGLTREDLTSSVLTTVLPDGDGPDQHPYEWLAGLCRAAGIVTTVEDLRAVPYVVRFSARVLARLPSRPDGG